MPEPTLDWSTAEVKDSTLTVQVDGELPDGWEDTFKATVALLGGGSWGEIKLEEQKAEVSGLTPGSEEKLRHFLESVVQQANATHHTGDEEEDEDEEDGEDSEEEDDEGSDSDKEMAERFRSFGEKNEGSDEGGAEDGEEGSQDREEGSQDESKDDSSE
jgi:hypothetical protein